MTLPSEEPFEAIRRLLRRGAAGPALQLALRWVQTQPRDARAWTALAELQRRFGATARALEAATRAAELLPDDFDAQAGLARMQLLAGQRSAAERCAERAAALAQTAAQHNRIGVLLSDLERHSTALHHFGLACAAEPADAHIAYNLALAQRFMGQIPQAIETCERILRIAPRHSQAHALRAELGGTGAREVALMEGLVAQGGWNWEEERNLRFALARACEDLQDYPRAFDHCKRGNALQRAQLRYDVQNDVRAIHDLIEAHSAEALAALDAGCPDRRPIFLVGLPRTGSTLLERVLSGHPEVTPAGERQEFQIALSQVAARHAKTPGADAARAALALPPAQLGDTYLQLMQPWAGARRRFTDKRPLNYLYCGLIAAALPQAHIVLVERNPMDACYAIYKTLFGWAYPFAYDLDDLARYYIAYHRLVEHWAAALGGRLLRVRYERLVEDPEGQARRVLSHCGLPWEERCLRFHEQALASTTASAVQVRKPIYASSVGKWRHYEEQLAPLARRLQQAGIAVE